MTDETLYDLVSLHNARLALYKIQDGLESDSILYTQGLNRLKEENPTIYKQLIESFHTAIGTQVAVIRTKINNY